MKKNIIVVFMCLFSFMFFLACEKTEQGTSPSVSSVSDQSQSNDSTSGEKFETSTLLFKVKTFSDYSKVKSVAFSDYSAKKSQAFINYSRVQSEAIKIYLAFKKSELEKVRSAEMATYLKWIDAEKMGDYNTMTNIEKNSPIIAVYAARTQEKWAEYEKKNKIAWEEYEGIVNAEWKRYEQIDASAYAEYEANKDNDPSSTSQKQ